MTDQMQARVLNPDHPCRTPHLDRLAARGVRFRRAVTPNAVCSPARASLMTGLLPHNHGVMWVTHVVDSDQGLLRTDKPHWAQRLQAAGYDTAYFGKWHVERSNSPSRFGWATDGTMENEAYKAFAADRLDPAYRSPARLASHKTCQAPGYADTLHYGVTRTPPEQRPMGVITAMAEPWLETALKSDRPWCVCVSVPEPHDPFVCGEAAYALYSADALELPPNACDPMTDKPALYRRAAAIWRDLTDAEKKQATACYYASITELDAQFGRLIERVEQAGAMDNTLVIFVADHGEFLGAHGLYCKNFGAFEEAYNIPLIMAGPDVAAGVVSNARVGSQDLCPTILDATGAEPIPGPDSRSFAAVLRNPDDDADFQTAFAEYHGGRYLVSQRIFWEDNWKFVFNGFDYDELYDLERDPFEKVNLAARPECRARVERMMTHVWQRMRDTGDHSLMNTGYPILRIAAIGPEAETGARIETIPCQG